MRLFPAFGTVLAIAALCLSAQELNEGKGIPPRATAADYQAHALAGTVTVATGLFGPSGARLKLSVDDFSLRMYAKKMTSLPSQPVLMVFRSLKDPAWEDSVAVEQKAKSTSVSTGGQAQTEKPAPVHMPLDLQRAMQLAVQKTALPEGNRALPQAGLLFFLYRGKVKNIHSIELVYAGPAGTATLTLQP